MTHRTWKKQSFQSPLLWRIHTRWGMRGSAELSCPHPVESRICHPSSTSICSPTRKLHRTSMVRVFIGVLLCCHTWLNHWTRDWTQSSASSTPWMSKVLRWLKVPTLSIHVIGLSGDYVSSSLELYARNLKQRADKYFFIPQVHLATICLPYLSFCLILFTSWVLQSPSQMPYFLPLNCYKDWFLLNVTLPSLTTNSNHCCKFSLTGLQITCECKLLIYLNLLVDLHIARAPNIFTYLNIRDKTTL